MRGLRNGLRPPAGWSRLVRPMHRAPRLVRGDPYGLAALPLRGGFRLDAEDDHPEPGRDAGRTGRQGAARGTGWVSALPGPRNQPEERLAADSRALRAASACAAFSAWIRASSSLLTTLPEGLTPFLKGTPGPTTVGMSSSRGPRPLGLGGRRCGGRGPSPATRTGIRCPRLALLRPAPSRGGGGRRSLGGRLEPLRLSPLLSEAQHPSQPLVRAPPEVQAGCPWPSVLPGLLR